MIERLCKLLFWSALIFALVMANMPQPALAGAVGDKYMHMLAFATLAGLAAFAYPRAHLLLLFLGLALFGALIEWTQLFIGNGRHADLIDWFADILAAGAVLAAIGLMRFLLGMFRVDRDAPSEPPGNSKP